MKFNNYLIFALLLLFSVNTRTMEDDRNSMFLPIELWKNIQELLFYSQNQKEIANLFLMNCRLASNIYTLLKETPVSALHWHLLSKNIEPRMCNHITNGKASNDGSFIVYRIDGLSETNRGLFIFDIKHDSKKKIFAESSIINGISRPVSWVLSNNNNFIVYEHNGNLYSYDIKKDATNFIVKCKQQIITSLSMSPDDRKIIICYKTDEVMIYDTITQKSIYYLPVSNALSTALISPDNNFLVTVEHDYVINVTEVNVLNAMKMTHLYSITRPIWIPSSAISQVSIDATSTLLFLRTARNDIAIYDIATGKIISSHTQESAAILRSDAIYVNNGYSDCMVSTSLDNNICNYELVIAHRSGAIINETGRYRYYCPRNIYGKLVNVSKDNTMAVLALSDGSIKLFDLHSGRHITFKNPYLRPIPKLVKSNHMQALVMDQECFIPESLFISDDNKKIIIIMASGTVIWNIEDCLEMLNDKTTHLNLLPAGKPSSKCTIL